MGLAMFQDLLYNIDSKQITKTKMKMSRKLVIHPMIIFWLGVLTGAVVLGMVFLERVLRMVDYQAALYKYSPKVYELQLDKVPKSMTQAPKVESQDKMKKFDPSVFGEINPIGGP